MSLNLGFEWKSTQTETKKRNMYREVSLNDFKEVKDITLIAKDNYSDIFKLCYTKHSLDRCLEQVDRNCTLDRVEELIQSKGDDLLASPLSSEYTLLSEDKKLAVVIVMERIEGFPSIIVKTVIRKVVVRNGIERELIVHVNNRSAVI